MAPEPTAHRQPPEPDPIADARALVAMAVGLGHRSRQAHRLGAVTDRKASLYINTLVRHAARLLQSSLTHDVPTLHASSNSPGGNAAHYVVRHDRLLGPPQAVRFLVVGSDARLRCCVVSEAGGARIWADYEVTSAPADLPMRVVMDALSALIAKLDQAVTQLESTQLTRELQLEADIAASKARIAGLSATIPNLGKRQPATSEEPVRPWTRHVRPADVPLEASAAPAQPPAQAVASASAVAISEHAGIVETAADGASTDGADIFGAVSDTVSSAPASPSPGVSAPPAASNVVAPDVAERPPSAPDAAAPPRRGFRLSRLRNTI